MFIKFLNSKKFVFCRAWKWVSDDLILSLFVLAAALAAALAIQFLMSDACLVMLAIETCTT